MLFYNYTKDKDTKKESDDMVDEKICKLREELNDSIINGNDYSITYRISVELDELIAQYYGTREKKQESKVEVFNEI